MFDLSCAQGTLQVSPFYLIYVSARAFHFPLFPANKQTSGLLHKVEGHLIPKGVYQDSVVVFLLDASINFPVAEELSVIESGI